MKSTYLLDQPVVGHVEVAHMAAVLQQLEQHGELEHAQLQLRLVGRNKVQPPVAVPLPVAAVAAAAGGLAPCGGFGLRPVGLRPRGPEVRVVVADVSHRDAAEVLVE